MSSTPAGMLLFLKCHGPLVEEFHDKSVRLTMAGRLFAVSFLVSQSYVTENDFAEVRRKVLTLDEIGDETNKMLSVAAKKWLDATAALVDGQGEKKYAPTDLPLNSVRALFSIMVTAQEMIEAARKPS